MNSRDEIYQKLVEILVDEFELNKENINLDVNLYKELDLDSIDAVDLVVRLQEVVGKKVDPETFKSVRTVKDVVDAIENLINS